MASHRQIPRTNQSSRLAAQREARQGPRERQGSGRGMEKSQEEESVPKKNRGENWEESCERERHCEKSCEVISSERTKTLETEKQRRSR